METGGLRIMEHAIDLFVDIAKQYDNYDDIKDRVRGLHSFGELTDEEYNYLIAEWDNLLVEYGL